MNYNRNLKHILKHMLANRDYNRFSKVQGVLAYHVFWGEEETVIGKIRDKQG